jgi:hypothetical protein
MESPPKPEWKSKVDRAIGIINGANDEEDCKSDIHELSPSLLYNPIVMKAIREHFVFLKHITEMTLLKEPYRTLPEGTVEGMKTRTLWVYGRSGVGKTTLVKVSLKLGKFPTLNKHR